MTFAYIFKNSLPIVICYYNPQVTMSLPHLNSFDDLPGRFRVNTVASSLSNLYHQYDIHINVLKWTGIIVMMSLTAATLGITNNLYQLEKVHWNSTDCIKIQEQPNFNQTLCSYIKPFRLPNEYYVTVCKYGNRTLIDIRQYLNQRPTIKGVSLSTRQWTYLMTIRHHITRAIPQ